MFVEFFLRRPIFAAVCSIIFTLVGVLAIPSLPRHVPLVRMEDGGMADQMIEYALYVALRQLRRSRGFAATVIATLALGSGGTTAVFSVVQAVLIAPLP